MTIPSLAAAAPPLPRPCRAPRAHVHAAAAPLPAPTPGSYALAGRGGQKGYVLDSERLHDRVGVLALLLRLFQHPLGHGAEA